MLKGQEDNKSDFRVVLRLLIVSFVSLSSMYFLTPALGDLAKTFEVSVGQVGALTWMNTFGYVVATLVLDLLLQYRRFEYFMKLGLIVLSISNLLMAFIPLFWAHIILRWISGFAAGLVIPTAWIWVFKNCSPQYRSKAVGLLSLDLMLAYTVGLPLGAFLLQRFGIKMSFSIIGGLSLLSIIFIQGITDRSDEGLPPKFGAREHFCRMASFLFQKKTRLFLLLIFLWSFGYHSVFNFIGVWLDSVRKGTLSREAIFLVFGLLASVGCLTSPKLVRIGPLLIHSVLALCCCLLGYFFSLNPMFFILVIGFWFYFDRAAFTQFFSRMDQVEEKERGLFTTFVIFVLVLSSTIGTALTGKVLDITNENMLVLPMIYIGFVGISLVYPAAILIRTHIFRNRS